MKKALAWTALVSGPLGAYLFYYGGTMQGTELGPGLKILFLGAFLMGFSVIATIALALATILFSGKGNRP